MSDPGKPVPDKEVVEALAQIAVALRLTTTALTQVHVEFLQRMQSTGPWEIQKTVSALVSEVDGIKTTVEKLIERIEK